MLRFGPGSPAVFVWLMGLLVWLAGCGAHLCPRLAHTDADLVMRSHSSMRTPLRSLRAEARIDQRNRKGRIRGTVMMFIERPDRVRFDATTQFGLVASLTSSEGQFAFADLRKRLFLHGESCTLNIARLIGLPLQSEQLTQLLLGAVPAIHANSSSLMCTEDGHYRVIRYGLKGERQEAEFAVREADQDAPPSQQHLRLAHLALYDAHNNLQWQVRYDDYTIVRGAQETRGVAMPQRVHFIDHRRDSDTIIRFKRMDINVEPPANAFVQTPPPGMRIRKADCP